MKAVLISIRPRGCEKILSGEKTIEVRKTMPSMSTPFKCFFIVHRQMFTTACLSMNKVQVLHMQ